MRLRTKFNLALLAACSVGLATAGPLTFWLSREAATAQVLNEARIMMEGAGAVRTYTVEEINPIILPVMKDRFFPQTVAAHAALAVSRTFRARFPDYSYREVALNPTNPGNRATDWESDLIRAFRDTPQLSEITTIRDTPSGLVQVLAHPIRVKDPGCLTCHGVAKDAPAAMLAQYGDNHGFGWAMNEIVGAQIASVPMGATLRRALEVFLVYIGTLIAGFVVIALVVNVLLDRLAIAPIKLISKAATDVSVGRKDVPPVHWTSGDEIGELSAAFNRIRRSLDAALRLLK